MSRQCFVEIFYRRRGQRPRRRLIFHFPLIRNLMKVCIIGCGAVGSLFAAHLAKAQEVEVWAYDLWREHIEAIRKNGLRLSGAAEFTTRLNATTNARELPRCDYGIVATKAIHTASAIAQTAHAFDDNSAVCSVQNGVGNEEIIADHVKFVIRGTTFPAGHPIGPGHIGLDPLSLPTHPCKKSRNSLG